MHIVQLIRKWFEWQDSNLQQIVSKSTSSTIGIHSHIPDLLNYPPRSFLLFEQHNLFSTSLLKTLYPRQ